MSQATHRDLEGGNDPNGHHHQPRSTPNQPLQVESNFGDSSGPLFSIYSKAAEEEDNKMVERWQKDADGILIFTGLFSAAVAGLLAVTVQDLRPNSQDTSAFYLGNIYEVLADPNATRASTSPTAKPPPFSRPRYAVWVNSLWFLSLVMSLSCALWATSLHQWARRYVRLTQPARCSPEKRARMHAFFAEGVDKMHIPWAVEGLPTLLHLSLFLFFGGLAIFLFNVDQEVFMFVVWWIGLFSMVYGLVTVLPLIRHNSPYNSPLSQPAWFLYSSVKYVTFTVLLFIASRYGSHQTWGRREILRTRYRGWMSGGVEKAAEEVVSKRSSEIDVRILGWTISALGDDDSLEKFFEAIPGFFNSRLVKRLERDFLQSHFFLFWGALNRFMGRTSSSNSVSRSVKYYRDFICRDIMSMLPCPHGHIYGALLSHFDQVPVSIERLQFMAGWFTHLSDNVSDAARFRVGVNLPKVWDRDDRWVGLASEVYGLAARHIREHVAMGGDNTLLALLIHVSRQANHSYKEGMLGLVQALTEIDIRHTLPGLQHDFCTLWNELVQEGANPGHYTSVKILRLIRRLYITLHQGTDAAPTAFTASTYRYDKSLFEPSSYPLCDIAGHRSGSTAPVPLLAQPTHSPDTSPHRSTSGGNTASQDVNEASNIARPSPPPDPTTLREIGNSSQAPAVTSSPALPALIDLSLTHASPQGAVATALQDIPLAATLSQPLEGTAQPDMVVPCPEPDINEIPSIMAHTPTLVPVPASTPPVLNASLTSCEGTASTSDPFLPASSVVRFSTLAPSPPSRVTPLPSNSPSKTTLSRLPARGLVDSRNMSFVNAVSHLLVHSPPFWDLFRELGDLKGKRGGRPETGDGATPLVDATVGFFEEFLLKEPPMQLAAGGKPREDEDATKEHNSVNPMYVYDAMKQKGRLETFMDAQEQDAEEFFRLYLDALDEELLVLLRSSGGQKSATSPPGEEREVSRSGQPGVDAGKRGSKTESVESPVMRILGGKFRSTLHAPNQPDTVTIEDWRSLQIDVQHDSVLAIEDAVARISHLQPVQLGPSGSSEESKKQVLIEVLPSVLVLHLKRFLYDVATDGIVKISKSIQFAPQLEIPLEIMTPVFGKSAEAVQYKLYGVLYHHGESAASGHYTVDVLHPNRDSGGGEAWLHIDDEVVNPVQLEDVFGSHDNERVDPDDRSAHMLFYCCTGPTQT